MPRANPVACVSLPGGASHVATIAGAASALDETIDVPGWSGASAGGLVAIAKAFAVPDRRIHDLLRVILRDNRMLDVAPFELGDMGICSWQVIPDAIDELLGKGAMMGDALTALVVVASDLGERRPQYFSRKHTPRVLVREVARATSAFPLVAPQVKVPSFTDDGRLFTDGGVTDNTTDAVWDGWSVPRVAVRLTGSDARHDVHYGDPLAQSFALVGALQFSAGTMKSTRQDGLVVDVPKRGDGMDFSLSIAQIDERWNTGRSAVLAHASALKALRSASNG